MHRTSEQYNLDREECTAAPVFLGIGNHIIRPRGIFCQDEDWAYFDRHGSDSSEPETHFLM
jgi:hypothetical protein